MRYGRVRAINVPSTAAGPGIAIASARFRLCGWSLQASGGFAVPTQLEADFAAAAAGSLTLTGFTQVNSITVTPAAAWPAGLNQVSVTNVQGGSFNVDIPGGTTNPVIVTFIPPVGTVGTPVVSVPAIVGGPAYNIAASGATGGAPAGQTRVSATFFDAGTIVGQMATVTGEADTEWLGDQGIEITSALTLTVTLGTIAGCVYVREYWPGPDTGPAESSAY